MKIEMFHRVVLLQCTAAIIKIAESITGEKAEPDIK